MYEAPEKRILAVLKIVVPLGAPESDGVSGAVMLTVQLAERVVLLPAASVDLIDTE